MLLEVDKALLDLLDRDAGVTCVKSGGVVWLKTKLEMAKVSFGKLQDAQEVNGRLSQTTEELIYAIRAMEKADQKVNKLHVRTQVITLLTTQSCPPGIICLQFNWNRTGLEPSTVRKCLQLVREILAATSC